MGEQTSVLTSERGASLTVAAPGTGDGMEVADTPAEDPLRERALDEFFDGYLRLHPVHATFIGDHRFDHQLPDWSPEGLSAARSELSELRRTLAAAGLGLLDDDAIATRDWRAIDGALADASLEIALAELGTSHFQRGNLSLALGEALFGLIGLMTRPFADIEQRATALAGRLRAFPLFLVGVRRTLEEGATPESWRERVIRECTGGRLLLEQVESFLESEGAPASIRADARVGLAVARESLSWFTTFVKGLRTAPLTRYAAGSPILELLIRRGHWMEASAESLRWEAHEVLEEEYQRLYVVLRRAGMHEWREARDELARHHAPPALLAQSLQETWDACRRLTEERALATWPEMPLRFAPAARHVRTAAPYLYYLPYRSPAPFDDESVAEYTIPSPDQLEGDGEALLRQAWNSAAIKLNHIAHHGGIGHHLQNWHARRAPSRMARVAAVDCASRIAMFSGGTMAEGWACYATDLMEEHEFLSPLERVAQQYTRVRLLARAVVDLELHGGRMSFDDAVATYAQRVGMTPVAARAEATKNSMFPGTAMMYWLGMRELRRLRAERQRALGTGFSLKNFHDELLSFGSIPVTLAGQLLSAERRAPTAERRG